jgi:hypothetical protein
MGLLNLQTNLKSLKYGKDRPDGGSSNQPYIITDIPSGISTLSNYDNDFILRGGILAGSRTAQDVSRLTQMFVDTKSPNGILFTIKQNALTRLGVKTQAGGQEIYLPTSTLAQAGVSAFGLHLYKQGLNPIPLPSNSSTISLGPLGAISSNGNIITYSQIVKPGNVTKDIDLFENRLYRIYETKVLGLPSLVSSNITNPSDTINIFKYGGGPGSILGIGPTYIKFADQRTGRNNTYGPEITNTDKYLAGNYQTTRKPGNFILSDGTIGSKNLGTVDPRYYPMGVSRIYDDYVGGGFNLIYQVGTNPYTFNNLNDSQSYNNSVYKSGSFDILNQGNNGVLTLNWTQTQENGLLNKSRGASSFLPKIQDFRAILRQDLTKSSIISDAPSYATASIETRVNLGNPGTPGNILSYTIGKILPGDSTARALDTINAKQIYESENVSSKDTNDLCKFRIEALDNDFPTRSVFIHFRAFLDSITDSYTSDWSPVKYIGRGENFYNYNGFNRSFSLGWTIAAQSKDELIPMYQKLNYLASNMMPDYSKAGYMRGPLIILTVGGYLYSQPGFMTSLTYTIDESTPWEIGINDKAEDNIDTFEGIRDVSDKSVKELPHVIKAQMNFTPIHRFIPRKQENKYGDKGQVTEWGKEHFIALATSRHNNYDMEPKYMTSPIK